jgi:hypothetical protein
VSNNSAHFAFTPFRQLSLTLAGTVCEKAKEANKPMPTNDMQTEFCLSYHVQGSVVKFVVYDFKKRHKLTSFARHEPLTLSEQQRET